MTRGARGAARASTLDELQEELERPFTEQELAEIERADGRAPARAARQAAPREAREAARVASSRSTATTKRGRRRRVVPSNCNRNYETSLARLPEGRHRATQVDVGPNVSIDPRHVGLGLGRARTRAPCSSAARAASRACTCAATRGWRRAPTLLVAARVSIAFPTPRPMNVSISPKYAISTEPSSRRSNSK